MDEQIFTDNSPWWINIGNTLPQKPDYTTHRLLEVVKKGDILYEAATGYGLKGHIGIVEGIFYDDKYGDYVRIIEVIDSGVVRSVLDDARVNSNDAILLRVEHASDEQIDHAVKFCIDQLGKDFKLDLAHDTGSHAAPENDWYDSELVWAAYYNNDIDLEGSVSKEPGVTPSDIRYYNELEHIPFRR